MKESGNSSEGPDVRESEDVYGSKIMGLEDRHETDSGLVVVRHPVQDVLPVVYMSLHLDFLRTRDNGLLTKTSLTFCRLSFLRRLRPQIPEYRTHHLRPIHPSDGIGLLSVGNNWRNWRRSSFARITSQDPDVANWRLHSTSPSLRSRYGLKSSSESRVSDH